MPVKFILAACFYGVRRNTYLFLSLKPTMGPCSGQLQKRRSHHTLRHTSHRLLKRRRDGENVSRPIGPEELVVLVQYRYTRDIPDLLEICHLLSGLRSHSYFLTRLFIQHVFPQRYNGP